MNAIELYKKYFPYAQPNLFQLEYIEANVTDLARWNEALTFWACQDYRAQSVFKMVEYYKEIGTPKSDPGRNTQPDIEPDCATCCDVGFWYEQIDDNPLHAIRHDCDCMVTV